MGSLAARTGPRSLAASPARRCRLRSLILHGRAMAERWLSTKATRSAKTGAGYRSLLDNVVLPRWKDVPLRDVRFDDLQVWITSLSVDGSVRFEGKGLSASRVRRHTSSSARYSSSLSRPSTCLPVRLMPSRCLGCLRPNSGTSRISNYIGLPWASGRLRTLIMVLGY